MKMTDIHKQVSRDYVRMLEAASSRSPCCAPPSGPGTIAAVAGYAPEARDLDAASQSFGCGTIRI